MNKNTPTDTDPTMPNPQSAPCPPSIVLAKEGTLHSTPPAPTGRRKIRRNGRVACLPKLQRDMVNHMLWNAIPYKNIVAAIDEEGYTVTERQISSWATGGYLEWSLAQEHVVQN